jgi:hypothetical protein
MLSRAESVDPACYAERWRHGWRLAPAMKHMRVLDLHGTMVPPPRGFRSDRFARLSPALEGDVPQEIRFGRPEHMERHLGPNSFPVFEPENLRYHFLPGAKGGLWSKPGLAGFFLSQGRRVYGECGFDCAAANSHAPAAIRGVD